MSATTILLDAALASVTAILYVYVGVLTLRRPASDAASRRALRSFALWWIGLAAFTVLGISGGLLGLAGYMDVGLHEFLGNIGVIPLVVILWGLVSYLAYIYTGSERVFLPVTILHAAILVYLLYLANTLDATAATLGEWRVQLDYERDIGGVTSAVILAAILLPALASAIGYASLYFRTTDRSARYRIAMVSGAFLLWFGFAGIGGATPLSDWEWWPLLSRAVALAATLMVLAAYRPPGWARERFGLRSTDERSDEPRPAVWRTARATLLRLSA